MLCVGSLLVKQYTISGAQLTLCAGGVTSSTKAVRSEIIRSI